MSVDISNELNTIKSTQLGRTMRPALHDAIYKQNKELNRSSALVDEFIKNAQQVQPQNVEIVAARIDNTPNVPVVHATLGKRLDSMREEVNVHLATKANKNEVFSMANMGQDVKEAMTGGSVAVIGKNTVLTDNIVDMQVTPQKVSFLKQSKNLFNKNNLKEDGYYKSTGWVFNDRYNSYIVDVVFGETYCTNVAISSYIVFFDINDNLLSELTIERDTWETIINVPNDDRVRKMAFAFEKIENTSTLMLCHGTNIPEEYVEYSFSLTDEVKISDTDRNKFINNDDLTLGVVSRNIFDYTVAVEGKEIYQDGSFKDQAQSMITGFIPVSGGTLYISGLTSYSSGLDRFAFFYDEELTPLGTYISIPKTDSETLLNIPFGAKYFAMSIYQRKTSDEVVSLQSIQIELSSKKTDFEPYEIGIEKIKGFKIKGVEGYKEGVDKLFNGKSLLIFGDSQSETATISDDGSIYTEGKRSNWPKYTKEKLGFETMWNYAKSGAKIADDDSLESIRQRITHQIETAISNNRHGDIIIYAGGTNDRDSITETLGDYDVAMNKEIEDLDKYKIYEALRWSFYTLRKNYPNSMFFCVIPIQNTYGELNPLLREAITKMANKYNFIIIDAQNESGIVNDFEIKGSSGRDLYDGLHPNVNGQIKMSNLINNKIKTIR